MHRMSSIWRSSYYQSWSPTKLMSNQPMMRMSPPARLTRPQRLLRGYHGSTISRRTEIVPFEIERSIAADFFGHTQSAVCTVGPTAGTVYLLKTQPKPRKHRRTDEDRLKREISVLRRLQHVHVISLVGAYSTSRYFTLVLLPYVESSLRYILEGEAGVPVLTKSFGCLTSALSYLHQSRVRHNDIKPSNILIKNNSVVFDGFEIVRD